MFYFLSDSRWTGRRFLTQVLSQLGSNSEPVWYCYIKSYTKMPHIVTFGSISCENATSKAATPVKWRDGSFRWREAGPPPLLHPSVEEHSQTEQLRHSGPFSPSLRLFDVRMLRNGSGESGEGGEGRGEDNDQVKIAKKFTHKKIFCPICFLSDMLVCPETAWAK